MATETYYKHIFECKNGELKFDNPEMLKTQKQIFEGKKGYCVFYKIEDKPSTNQWAFLYGGIIKAECMNSNSFAAFKSESEILNYFAKELRSYNRIIVDKNGVNHIIDSFDDISTYNMRQLSTFIDEVIVFLSTEFGITVKHPESYKTQSRVYYKKK